MHFSFILVDEPPEMEFLDINLIKDLSLFLHAIHSPFVDFKENHTLLRFSKS
jgi:hypothetical protein